MRCIRQNGIGGRNVLANEKKTKRSPSSSRKGLRPTFAIEAGSCYFFVTTTIIPSSLMGHSDTISGDFFQYSFNSSMLRKVALFWLVDSMCFQSSPFSHGSKLFLTKCSRLTTSIQPLTQGKRLTSIGNLEHSI